MSRRDDYRRTLAPLLADAESAPEALEQALLAGSNLPGPRGNLELSAAFADLLGEGPGLAVWALVERWAALTADAAPTGTAREFLPFVAIEAHGAAWVGANARRRARLLEAIEAAADDPRWRVREAVAMALQRIGEADFPALRDALAAWLPKANLSGQRAILAALAHPPILKRSKEATRFALDCGDRILEGLPALDKGARRTEPFRQLRKGLDYALSVFVENLPEEGFARLRRWAAVADPDIRGAVRSNVGKARLVNRFGSEVARVVAVLEGAPPGPPGGGAP